MSSKKKQSVSSAKPEFSSAAQYLWAFLRCKTSPTKAENEDSAQITSNKLCVYCHFIFNGNNGITPLTEAEAELLTKMCPYHHNKETPRIIYSEPQDPGQICGQCTVVLRYYMQRCIFTGNFSNEPRMCLASVNRPGGGNVFANSDGEFESKESNNPSASTDEDDAGDQNEELIDMTKF
ncbi:Hypothetical predicted protein [Cloeon dipterum]|uniref:Uncharacterized protein n=1 Tax=Cloeon dipterum TaxID=197152 RepID=A0A8S1DVM2_9INSE|nr:Hypothetical predicted protein [Cloeon dipterum]